MVPTPRLFQLLLIFQCGHPSRSLRPTAAPRCITSFANFDTSVLDLLACLSLSVPSVVLFSISTLIGKAMLRKACSSITISVPECPNGASSPVTSPRGNSSHPGLGSSGTPVASTSKKEKNEKQNNVFPKIPSQSSKTLTQKVKKCLKISKELKNKGMLKHCQ